MREKTAEEKRKRTKEESKRKEGKGKEKGLLEYKEPKEKESVFMQTQGV